MRPAGGVFTKMIERDETTGLQGEPLASALPNASRVPLLRIRVFGGFDATLDGIPIDESYSRQRKLQALMAILALNHGQELYSDYLADSIWPRSAPAKKRHCFYNLWYVTMCAVCGTKREGNPYFERRHYTCRLLDTYVLTDVEEVERACDDLLDDGLQPAQAVAAYRRLQSAYRGDLLPGEAENPIIVRARLEWRERIAGSLSAAAQKMADAGEDRTALWLASVACRLNGLREDVVRLRMQLFAKMGMHAYALRAYRELEEVLNDEVGVSPSPQSVELMQQVFDAGELGFALRKGSASRRRGSGVPAERETCGKADLAYGNPLALRSGSMA